MTKVLCPNCGQSVVPKTQYTGASWLAWILAVLAARYAVRVLPHNILGILLGIVAFLLVGSILAAVYTRFRRTVCPECGSQINQTDHRPNGAAQ